VVDKQQATSDEFFESLLAEANLPETTVTLCLDAQLLAEYEEIRQKLAGKRVQHVLSQAGGSEDEGDDTRLGVAGPGETREPDPELGQLEEQLKKLEKLKQERSVTFLLRGLSAQRYNQLYHEHPPRRDPGTGAVDVRDAYGYNSATFPAALVRASIVQPRMTDARWNKTINLITEGQFNKLFEAARQLTLRLRDQDVPF